MLENEHGLYRLRKNSIECGKGVRARLQSCHKCRKINVGFSPCVMLLDDFARTSLFFRSLFSP
jgi:hypothetical protein